MFGKKIALDIGTANTRLFVAGEGIVLNQPTVIAEDISKDEIIATGDEAKAMLGRTPEFIEVHRPVADGVIADIEMAERLLSQYLKDIINKSLVIRPKVSAAVHYGITDVEKRAVRDSLRGAGFSNVELVEQPIAGAIGADLSVDLPQGNMVVDLGAGTTEIAVISLDDIVTNTIIRVGGAKLDEAIIDFAKRHSNILIGENVAEELKIKIGSVSQTGENDREMEISGRSLVDGIPKTVTFTSKHIRSALEEPLSAILTAIKRTLEDTPPELAGDIIDNGIVMMGGGALLRGIAPLVSQATNLMVRVVDDPLTCLVNGVARIMMEPNKYGQVGERL